MKPFYIALTKDLVKHKRALARERLEHNRRILTFQQQLDAARKALVKSRRIWKLGLG